MDEDSMSTQQRTDDMVTEEGSSTESDAERLIKEGARTLGAKQHNQCYCSKERDLSKFEMQCVGCFKWFHEACLSITIPKCLQFITNYAFICKNCNPSGQEVFQKKAPSFSQMCVTALANLLFKSRDEGTNKNMFSKDKEIIPFVDRNWEQLTTAARRTKHTWHNTILKTLQKETDLFLNQDDVYFGLYNPDLYRIMPIYDATSKITLLKEQSVPGKRGPKRKLQGTGESQGTTSGKSRVKSDLVMPKLPAHGYPNEHPFNKDGFRYILAEPDPHAPFRQEFDDSVDWAGKPIPGWLYRKLEPEKVLLTMHDRAPQLKISEDRLSVTGEKGYCMVRATHSVTRGNWYFEVAITEMPDNSAVRIGWCLASGNLQAPLGYDKFGYSWRSRKGTKFHESIGKHYADTGYGVGDHVGFMIELPTLETEEPSATLPILPSTYKDRPLVKFKQYLYYEEADKPQQAAKHLQPREGAKISFFKNGVYQGVAFENIYGGSYYPAFALYKSATIKVNFGGKFKCPPQTDIKYQPMSDAVNQSMIEQTLADTLYMVENDNQFRVDALNF